MQKLIAVVVDKDTVTLSDNPIVLGYDVEVCVFVCACVHACVLLVDICMHMRPCVCALLVAIYATYYITSVM